MNIFLSAQPAAIPKLSEYVAGALASLPELRPDQATLFYYDPRFGPLVQEQVDSQIAAAEIFVADVTGSPSKVLLELGLAVGLKKPIVIIAEDTSEIPMLLREAEIVLASRSASESHLSARLGESFNRLLNGINSTAGAKQKEHVFISYSHKDSDYLARMMVHLRPLEREQLLELWSDSRIRPGDRWQDEISAAISRAGAAVLLISADFLASDFIVTNELPPLLAAAEERGTQIIPIIVRPSRFQRDPRIGRFQALNDPATPVIRMNEADREQLFDKLAETLEARFGISS